MTRNLRSYIVNDALKHSVVILWLVINVLLFYFTFMYYYNGPQFYYLHRMLGYGLCISRASAACINLNSSLLLFPMCKRLMTYLRSGAPIIRRQCRRMLDRGRSFHMMSGYFLCLVALVHCAAHVYNAVYFSKHYNSKYQDLNVAKYANQNPLLMLVTTLPGITGIMLVVCLILISAFAARPVRRKTHERFWTTHHLFIVYYALLFLHAADGVLKYQTNIDEHIPGCVTLLGTNKFNTSEGDPLVLPEPHAEPFVIPEQHPEPLSFPESKMMRSNQLPIDKTAMNKNSLNNDDLEPHQVVIPEPEPQPHGGDINSSSDLQLVKVDGTWLTVMPCKQPPPKFASCSKEVWKWLCIPLTLYFLERMTRLICSSHTAVKIEGFRLYPGDVMELKLSQPGFKAKPGQSVLLRCPAVSRVEYHPFSLTSLPSETDPTFGIHIKMLGDWTNRLREVFQELHLKKNSFPRLHEFNEENPPEDAWTYSSLYENRDSRCDSNIFQTHSRDDRTRSLLSANESTVVEVENSLKLTQSSACKHSICLLPSDDKCGCREQPMRNDFQQVPDQSLSLFIDGPLGSAMEDIHKYKVSVCVAGGIGITPFASLMNTFLKDEDVLKKTKLNRLYLIWACKNLDSFDWFLNIIERLLLKLWERNLPDFLSVSLYLTSVRNPEELNGFILSNSTLRKCALNYCRPDIDCIIENIANRHPKSTVGVFSCGPRGLLSSVGKSCLRSPAKTTFIINREAF